MQEHVRRKLEGERRSEEDFECLKCLPRQGTIRWLKLCIGTVLHEVPEDQNEVIDDDPSPPDHNITFPESGETLVSTGNHF